MELKFYIANKSTVRLIISSIIIFFIGHRCIKSDLLFINILGYLNLFVAAASSITAMSFHLKIKKPQLILSENGIQFHPITKGNISWKGFDDYKIYKERNNQILELKFDSALENYNFKYFYKKTAKKYLKEGIIKMNINLLNVDIESLKTYLNVRKTDASKVIA